MHDGAAHRVLQRVARRCTTSCRFLCSLATALRSHRLAGVALLLMLPSRVAPAVLGGTARGLSCTCAVGLVRVRMTVRARRPLRVFVPVMRWDGAQVCARACVCVLAAFPSASAFCARACASECVGLWVLCLCLCLGATALCWPSPWHGGTVGIYSAACDARTAAVCALRWPSVGSLVCTQARRGRAVRPRRNGLRDLDTRP